MTEKIINNVPTEKSAVLFGNYDENTDLVEKEFNCIITARESSLKVSGETATPLKKRQVRSNIS